MSVWDDTLLYIAHKLGIPTPFTPSSHLSPRSSRAPLSPISFTTTRSPSTEQLISPTKSPIGSKKSRRRARVVATRKGAWRGAEVLARMEEADRSSAQYQIAFDANTQPRDYDTDDDSLTGSTGRESKGETRRKTAVVSLFEESDVSHNFHICPFRI